MPYPRIRIPGPVTFKSWHPDTGAVERVEERLLVRDVFRVTFFIPRDHFDIADGVAHALDSYLKAVTEHPQALSNYTCCYWEPSPLDERGWELIRNALHPKARRFADDYTPDEAFYPLKDGADPYFSIYADDGSGYYFGYHARIPWREPVRESVSVLRMTLPTEYVEERGADVVHEFVLDLASGLPFASGHAGLALDTWGSVTHQLSRLRPVMFRHPGFDLRAANLHDNPGTRLDGVHWMNFIGQPVLGELGGSEGLRARLHSPGTTVREWSGERAVITLGPNPEAGDLDQGQTLPAYRELARLMEPWMEPFPWAFLRQQDRAKDEEELRRWWRRFLD